MMLHEDYKRVDLDTDDEARNSDEEEHSSDDEKGRKMAFYQTMEEDFENGQYYKSRYADHLQCCQGLNLLWHHEDIDCAGEENNNLFIENSAFV